MRSNKQIREKKNKQILSFKLSFETDGNKKISRYVFRLRHP